MCIRDRGQSISGKNQEGGGDCIALGSASKNSKLILERLELQKAFDVIVDGTMVTKAKPDPEVFLQGAKKMHINPENCIVFEDSTAGIEAVSYTHLDVYKRQTIYRN